MMKSFELSFWISRQEISFFTKNFSVMLGAGLPVVEALAVAAEQTHGKLHHLLVDMRQYVEQGNSLAEAFLRHRRQFSPVFVDVVRTGELSGTLARNIEQLALRLEADNELRRKVRGAMIYPLVVLVGLLGLISILAVFVLPRFVQLFHSLDVALPLMTQITVLLSQWVIAYWGWLLLVIGLVIVAARLLLRLAPIQAVWHAGLLRLPIVGPIIRSINLARFTGTLGSLLASGVPISEALQSVIHSCTNLSYQRQIRNVLQLVERGDSLAAELTKQPKLFPPLVTRMILVGEHTGQLADLLNYLGRYYEGEVDSATKQLGVLIEPVLLLTIGLVVMLVGLSVITPIYQFTASVGAL